MYDIRITEDCTRCGACVAVCPARVFVQNHEVKAARPAGCILCGHCVAVCPVDAVDHRAFDGQVFPAAPKDPPVTLDALVPFLRSRRSVREFKNRPLSPEMLQRLLDVARYAPTASNVQDVRYIVITDAERRMALSRRIVGAARLAGKMAKIPGVLALASRGWGRQRLEAYLAVLDRMIETVEAGGDPIFFGAPALIITHARKGNAFDVENSAYATYQMALTAHAMGLGTCMLGFLTTASRYDPGVRRLAGVPKGHRITTALIVGHPIYRYRRLVPRRPARVRWVEGRARNEASPQVGRQHAH